MSGPLRRCIRSLAALAVLLAVTAGAEAATPSKATVVLRGSQSADKTADKPAATPTPTPAAPAVDPGIGPQTPLDLSAAPRFQDSPAQRFSLDPAPRVRGLDLAGGGAQCRTTCAETRYQCRATDEADLCDRAWGQCITSCTEASSSAL